LDMFIDTWLRGFPIIGNITRLSKYFGGILNLLIALPTKYAKLNVEQILMISQYVVQIKRSWRGVSFNKLQYSLQSAVHLFLIGKKHIFLLLLKLN